MHDCNVGLDWSNELSVLSVAAWLVSQASGLAATPLQGVAVFFIVRPGIVAPTAPESVSSDSGMKLAAR